MKLSIRARNAATNKTLSLPPGQGIELGLLLLRLGLGQALEVVFVVSFRLTSQRRSARASWPQLPRVWYCYPPGKDQVTEHHRGEARGLVQTLLLIESILVQSNSLDDLAFHKN